MRLDDWTRRVKALKSDIPALYYAWRDPRVPLLSRLILVIALVYLLSPIDLIPDFIPVLGYLDDFVVVPALIMAAIRMIPSAVFEDCRSKPAAAIQACHMRRIGAVVTLLTMAFVAYLVFRLLTIR